uniref:Uncharacterized protein n=1 Tax=Oryza rufipogon TaxID=4529 RepID=A0A0E0Q9W4_ORYRU
MRRAPLSTATTSGDVNHRQWHCGPMGRRSGNPKLDGVDAQLKTIGGRSRHVRALNRVIKSKSRSTRRGSRSCNRCRCRRRADVDEAIGDANPFSEREKKRYKQQHSSRPAVQCLKLHGRVQASRPSASGHHQSLDCPISTVRTGMIKSTMHRPPPLSHLSCSLVKREFTPEKSRERQARRRSPCRSVQQDPGGRGQHGAVEEVADGVGDGLRKDGARPQGGGATTMCRATSGGAEDSGGSSDEIGSGSVGGEAGRVRGRPSSWSQFPDPGRAAEACGEAAGGEVVEAGSRRMTGGGAQAEGGPRSATTCPRSPAATEEAGPGANGATTWRAAPPTRSATWR